MSKLDLLTPHVALVYKYEVSEDHFNTSKKCNTSQKGASRRRRILFSRLQQRRLTYVGEGGYFEAYFR